MRARRGFGGFSLFKFFPKVVNVSSGVRADGKNAFYAKNVLPFVRQEAFILIRKIENGILLQKLV